MAEASNAPIRDLRIDGFADLAGHRDARIGRRFATADVTFS